MFLQRALITFTIGPLALYLIYIGGWLYFLPLLAVLMLATMEYANLMKRMGRHVSIGILAPPVFALLFVSQWWPDLLVGPVMIGGLLIIMSYALWLFEGHKSDQVSTDWVAMMGGFLLLGWLGSHFFLVRGMPENAWQWTMLAMLGTWLADSAAYLVGKFMAGSVLGRHKLSPRLSPNKTVEGYVGGIILGTGLTVGIAYFFNMGLPLMAVLLLGLLVSSVSPLGDLGISLLKREAGVKDSGFLFPGHGGALDRVDSLVWSVAMAYYLVLLIK